MTKRIEILIVVVALLLIAALVVGCKDEAEAVEPTQYEEIIHWDEDAECLTDCNFVIPEPSEPEYFESKEK